MKTLVTGATGIVGSNLVRALLDAGHGVRVLLRPSSDARSLADLPIERHEGDVLDPTGLAAAAQGCDVVFHAAAVFAYWGQNAEEQKDLAVRGTRNILEAAKQAGAGRVVVTSSSVTLGSSTTARVLTEDASFDEANPSAYTLSKLCQEKAAFDIGAVLGLDVVAVCPTLSIGAHDFRLSPSNAYIVNYLNDPFRSTFIGGCNIVSARDVAAGHILAAERGAAGRRYVLGSENLTWRQVHELISDLTGTFGPSLVLNHTASYLAALSAEVAARLAGTKPAVTRDEAKMSARFYWYDHARIAALGYKPMHSRQALAEATAWLLGRSYITDSVIEKLRLSSDILIARALLASGKAAAEPARRKPRKGIRG